MCRALAYLGQEIRLADLLHEPDSSLVRQSYQPQLLEHLNLGGFGLAAWAECLSSERFGPLIYRSTELPIYDNNLRSLADHVRAECLLAHVRGIEYRASLAFGSHNLHPFHYAGERWAMAHNGDLHGHRETRHALLAEVPAAIQQQIEGTTDSETVYAMVLAELRRVGDDGIDGLAEAVQRVLGQIRRVRREHGLATNSALNLLFADGSAVLGLRQTFDFGCFPLDAERLPQGSIHYLSLWYTIGERYRRTPTGWAMTGDPNSLAAAIVASEPLTRDVSGWVEVPEYSLLLVDPAHARLDIQGVRA